MEKQIFFNRILNNRYYEADYPIKIIMWKDHQKLKILSSNFYYFRNFDDVIRNSISILSFLISTIQIIKIWCLIISLKFNSNSFIWTESILLFISIVEILSFSHQVIIEQRSLSHSESSDFSNFIDIEIFQSSHSSSRYHNCETGDWHGIGHSSSSWWRIRLRRLLYIQGSGWDH